MSPQFVLDIDSSFNVTNGSQLQKGGFNLARKTIAWYGFKLVNRSFFILSILQGRNVLYLEYKILTTIDGFSPE